ncbi:glycoside hydrolase family 13 protein [Streptomyces sp. TS71-3]|uniref:glycoside hydrolase family 13 protein n=1 Tax=Streptomyces sp. TS71-3 TaxID=2733862 RepID=UPI001B04DEBB|nr:glycoside hydrolase family 13 protein [Streptomyces sp. TS71-3]GHJ38083.1 alpha-glucosidase [Streptomyces sp. TS71-3]
MSQHTADQPHTAAQPPAAGQPPATRPGGVTVPAARAAAGPAATHRDWWRDAVIYQVYPRSFADSNADGMGDLEGVRSRLPYLRELGVDAVWLSPFYASPQADAGYDVADYRAVDPMFGTLPDADALIRDAHALGLRVIVDIVPNHSSDRHEWFRRALAHGPGSPLRERYHFRPGKGAHGELPPNDWESIFGGPAWTRVTEPDGTPGEWYLHLFAPEQPDLNWDHPAVDDEFRSILRFWLDMGVDGFRVDVAHGLVKAPGLPDLGVHDQLKLLGNDAMPFFDQDGVHEIYRSWRRILDEYREEGPRARPRIFVAEAWTPTIERAANYVRPDELHQAFNFQYLSAYWDAAGLREIIDRSLDAVRPVGAPATWVLSNHDVTRHTTRYANPPGLGTQLRTAGDPATGLRRARAATLLMLALPGSAYLYQGEELGLPDVVDLPDEARQDPSFFRAAGQDGFRDGCRVPIPWTADGPSYGFGAGGSWLPQPQGWGSLSVQAQTGVAGSTLELYRAALAARRAHPALGAGDAVEWLDGPEGTLAFRRTPGGSGGTGFVCTANTTGAPVRVPAHGRLLLSSSTGGIAVSEDGTALLPADTTAWWTTR